MNNTITEMKNTQSQSLKKGGKNETAKKYITDEGAR